MSMVARYERTNFLYNKQISVYLEQAYLHNYSTLSMSGEKEVALADIHRLSHTRKSMRKNRVASPTLVSINSRYFQMEVSRKVCKEIDAQLEYN